MDPQNLTPRQLFRALDQGHLSREAFREAMRAHTQEVIEEMVEAHENPVLAWIDTMKHRKAAWRLVRQHGDTLIREIFVALAEMPNFPPAQLLWNADRPYIPLHGFFRTRLYPHFQLKSVTSESFLLEAIIEHGGGNYPLIQERITFHRDKYGSLQVKFRLPI